MFELSKSLNCLINVGPNRSYEIHEQDFEEDEYFRVVF